MSRAHSTSCTTIERSPKRSSWQPHVECLEQRVVLTTRIVTIGDSWASFIADGAPGSIADVPGNTNVFQTVLNSHIGGVEVYNGGFYGGTSANHVAQLSQITNIINAAGSDVDIVYLSSGGNDFLAGLLAGGWYRGKPAGEVQALFDSVGNNVQTVANHILSIRPDIQIVIASYDYINMWDFNITSGGDNVRLNLGLARSGNWAIDLLQNADMNAALRDLESRKAAIAASNSRIHHVNMFGLLHSLTGYQGYLSNNVNLPPGSYPDLPVKKSLLGSSGNDPIHLNDAGYAALVDNVYNNFIGQALQNGQLSLSTSFLAFGDVRVGTSSGTQSVTASNSGGNFTKVENLNFVSAPVGFTGGGYGVNPLFRDPTLGSDTAAVNYAFSPTTRGSTSKLASITSSAGSQSVQLTGRGVGPVFSGTPSLSLNEVRPGQQTTSNLSIANATSDGNLGALTNLTLVNASFSGPDGSLFQLDNFVPGTVLSAGQLQNLTVRFLGSTPGGTYNATLTLVTDQGAAYGATGQSFNIPISAFVNDGFQLSTGPDPANGALTALFANGWTGADSIAFTQLDPTTIQVTITKENGVTVNEVSTFNNISGRVIVNGDAGNDDISAQSLTLTAVSLSGGAGDDTLFGSSQADTVLGGDNDDLIYGGSGSDLLDGGDGADAIYGEHLTSSNLSLAKSVLGSDTINGGEGNDSIFGDGDGGEGAADLINGDGGDDTIIGDGSSGSSTAGDTIFGGGGNDTITGDGAEGAADSILGGAGDDYIDTAGGNDFADGGADNDILLGGDGAEGADDSLLGGDGRDILVGDRGTSTANVEGGTDSLDGGTGEDILIASAALLPDVNSWGLILAEWTSGRSYAERVANISGTGVGPRDNGSTFLTQPNSVQADNSNPPAATVDVVLGGDDQDWFFTEAEDTISDLALGEEVTVVL